MITLHKYVINGVINNKYAKVTYTFDFENSNKENASDELKFDLTIDPESFISSFVAYIDGKVFDGKVTPNNAYEQHTNYDYDFDTKSAYNGNGISLTQLDPSIPNVFQLQMTINPKSKILINITVEQYLRKVLHHNYLNIELLTNFDNYPIERMYRCIPFKLHISDNFNTITDIRTFSSSSADINATDDRNIIMSKNTLDSSRHNAILHGMLLLDDTTSVNQFIIKYKTDMQQNEAHHHLYDASSHTFCHVISNIIDNHNILFPRRVVFVVGTSDSSWKHTMNAIIYALHQLRIGYDRYRIMLFDAKVVCFPSNDAMIIAAESNIAQSIQFCTAAISGDGSNVYDALLQAIECIKDDIENVHHHHSEDVESDHLFMNQIIFVTDRDPLDTVTDTDKIQQIVSNVNQLASIDGYHTKISIYTFGISTQENNAIWIHDLNHPFLRALALNNHGFYKRIKKNQIEGALKQSFTVLSAPHLCNIAIEYDKPLENLTQTKFNALYAGNDLVVCGIFRDHHRDENMDIVLNATVSATSARLMKEEKQSAMVKAVHIEKKLSIVIHAQEIKETQEHVQKIWAHVTLREWMIDKWVNNENDDERKENILLPCTMSPLSVSMIHHLVTPWTSMQVGTAPNTTQSKQQKAQQMTQVKQKAQQMMHSFKDQVNKRWSPRKHISAVQDSFKRFQNMKLKPKNILYSKSFSFDEQSRSVREKATRIKDPVPIYPKPALQESKSLQYHSTMHQRHNFPSNKPSLESSVSTSLTSNCNHSTGAANHSTPNSVDLLLYSTPNSPSEALQDVSRHKWIEPKRIRYLLTKKNSKGEIFELYEWLKPTKLIGVGAYAAVCEVIDTRTNMKYAVKKNRNIFSNETDARRILREIKLLCHLSHPHVMNLCGVIPPSPYERDTYQDCYLIMPRMDGTLSSVVASNQTLSERHIQYFCYQIARGLEYMHSGGIIHRDLKPDNVLVNFAECTLKITDFGMSRGVRLDIESPQQLTEYVVTRWYRAPEIICCSKLYDYQIDIWALGCIAAELFTRTPIFKGKNCLDQLQLIFNYLGTPQDLSWITNENVKNWICSMPARPPFNLSRHLPNSTMVAQDFVRQLLMINPHKRPDIATTLKHEWLKEFVDESHYRQCPPFNISFEYEALIKTQFGVRHMMYTELHKFRKEFVREERGRTFLYPHESNIQQQV